MSDLVLDQDVDFDLIKCHFDEPSWAVVCKNLLKKNEDGLHCVECGRNIAEDGNDLSFQSNHVKCAACLSCFHTTCLKYTSNKEVKTWFCAKCLGV